MTSVVQQIETAIETWAEEAWAIVKPEVVGLGQTVLSQVETAAEVFVTNLTSGAPVAFADALASIVTQLPADIKAGEAIIANVLSASIVKAQAAAKAVPPPGS